ncbi:MAG: M23 family metallopeptidase [Pseudobdellovibrionaceae bacterium]|nr:M23 family metallopeptidase [Pseudobdellovibrionaceae bacterium]
MLRWNKRDAALSLSAGLVLGLAWSAGLAIRLGNLLLLIYLPLGLILRFWWIYKKTIAWEWIRRPFSRNFRWYSAQCLARWLFLAVWWVIFNLTVAPVQFGEEYAALRTAALTVLLGCAGPQLFPQKSILLAQNVSVALAAAFFAFEAYRSLDDSTMPETVGLHSPLRTEAYVLQGGRSSLVNHHYPVASQRHALDILVLKNGKESEGRAEDLASYGCFGQVLHAPATGTVVGAVNQKPDVAIGLADPEHPLGNYLVLEMAPHRYILLAHLRQNSLLVKVGDRVVCGQPLAQCGNSGNTSLPHLHIQVQNQKDFESENLFTLPIQFHGTQPVRRNSRIPAAPAECL